jgi:hypothetical protein
LAANTAATALLAVGRHGLTLGVDRDDRRDVGRLGVGAERLLDHRGVADRQAEVGGLRQLLRAAQRAPLEIGGDLRAEPLGQGLDQREHDAGERGDAGHQRDEFEAPWAGTFKAGVSAYGGRSMEIPSAAPAVVLPPGLEPPPGPEPAAATPAVWAYNERDYSVDAQWDHGGLHLQAEYIHHNRDPIGALVQSAPGAPLASTNQGTNGGFYALAGYRFDRLWRVMPFVFYEDWRPLGGMLKIRELNAGLNFRPTPSVVLKAMMSEVWMTGLPVDPLKVFTTQVAWVF